MRLASSCKSIVRVVLSRLIDCTGMSVLVSCFLQENVLGSRAAAIEIIEITFFIIYVFLFMGRFVRTMPPNLARN